MESSQVMIRSEQTQMVTEMSNTNVTVKKSHSRKKSMRKNKEEKNISVKSGSKMVQEKMKHNNAGPEVNPNCESCSRPVYAMERIKAERKIWHRECFRCKECNKQLSVETYQSHSSYLYCKPHFKSLFSPKAVEDEDEPQTPRKHTVIICESNPRELPPDVVRASDKADLGLEELSTLDVKSRFQMFENIGKEDNQPKPLEHPVSRDKSSALLSKLAKFKSKGMDIGVADECLNGIPIEPSSSEGEDEDSVLKQSYRHTVLKEQPVSFCNMSEIVGKFESGDVNSTGRREERKQEIQNIRSRLFMGKQAKIKEMYEQSVLQSEQSITESVDVAMITDIVECAITSAEKIARDLDFDNEKSRQIKQKFENGEIFKEDGKENRMKDIEDTSLFNDGIGKKSRSIFLELDANQKNSGPLSPPITREPRRKEKSFIPKDVIRSEDKVDDVKIETSDISNKFQFFETYKPKDERKQFRMTPPRDCDKKRNSPEQEIYRDPTIVRSEERPAAEMSIAKDRQTASRMIGVFKKMEEQVAKGDESQGPKPLKRFTPPPPGADYHAASSSEEEYSSEGDEGESGDEEPAYATSRHDEALKQTQALARAKNMRNRFENWTEHETRIPQSQSIVFERQPSENQDDSESQIESAKSIRAKFESLQNSKPGIAKSLVPPKVNRFV